MFMMTTNNRKRKKDNCDTEVPRFVVTSCGPESRREKSRNCELYRYFQENNVGLLLQTLVQSSSWFEIDCFVLARGSS